MPDARLACARIHRFALELWFAQNPSRKGDAVVLAFGDRADAVIGQCSHRAAEAGVQPGMTVAQGHSLCAGLVAVSCSGIPEQVESQKLVGLLQQLSPRVEEAKPGLYFLSLAGLLRLHGSEQALAGRILSMLGSRGLPATVGIAGSATAARVAAEISEPGTFTVVPRGRERRFLAGLSIAFLDPSPAFAEQLDALGITTIAQLAALPAGEIARRFGPEGTCLQAMAAGQERAPAVFAALPSDTACVFHFNFSCMQQAILLRHIRRMAGGLFGERALSDRAATGLRIELDLENGTRTMFTLAINRPAVSPSPFLRQLRERLQTTHFKAGVAGITVALEGITRAPVRQLECSHAGSSSLQGKPGGGDKSSNAIVPFTSARLLASHLPEESFVLTPGKGRAVNNPREEAARIPAYASGTLAGMRLLSPPRSVAVTEHRGIPATFRRGSRTHAIAQRRGPWELSGRWWDREFDRRYFEVETGAGERYLLFCDRPGACWYLQGVFD
jgi:hypothetical protein